MIPIEDTVAGRVFVTGKIWTGTREQALVVSPGGDPTLPAGGSKVSCNAPIPGRGRILGTFGLVRNEDNPYDDEVDFLMRLSKQLAVAVENVLLHEENRRLKSQRIEESIYVGGDSARSRI